MPPSPPLLSLDHAELLETLTDGSPTLLIQDLDGVCVGLVRDPLTRRIDRRYVEAAQRLGDAFRVLTNGEHEGRRGINGVVERAFDSPQTARRRGLYLPGLAAGGVQWQERDGQTSFPGVRTEELHFLQQVPAAATSFIERQLASRVPGLVAHELDVLSAASVLDNTASPTLNLNPIYRRLRDAPPTYRQIQQQTLAFMQGLLAQATAQGLADSFFIHLAPNLGRDDHGHERLLEGDSEHAGTTDFQFMLSGAIKEAGVLALLNRAVAQRSGHWPLGETFSVREAPRDLDGLLQLALDRLDPRQVPRLVGIGDTVSARPEPGAGNGEATNMQRGGSDRGFLTLIQALGARWGREHPVLYVDSSAGQVRRPGIDARHLQRCQQDPSLSPWPAVSGISDPQDPLRLSYVFPGGHRQYIEFFLELAQHWPVATAPAA